MAAMSAVPISGKRRSAAQWRTLVSAFEKGGLSHRVSCARHALPVSTLDWWRRRLEAAPRRRAVGAGSEALFVELSPPVLHSAHRGDD